VTRRVGLGLVSLVMIVRTPIGLPKAASCQGCG
jgi:hypothetical protein